MQSRSVMGFLAASYSRCIRTASFLQWRQHRALHSKCTPAVMHESQQVVQMPWMGPASSSAVASKAAMSAALQEYNEHVHVLLTTGAPEARALLSTSLPPRVRVQYVPLDNHLCIQLFLAHWRPQACILMVRSMSACRGSIEATMEAASQQAVMQKLARAASTATHADVLARV